MQYCHSREGLRKMTVNPGVYLLMRPKVITIKKAFDDAHHCQNPIQKSSTNHTPLLPN